MHCGSRPDRFHGPGDAGKAHDVQYHGGRQEDKDGARQPFETDGMHRHPRDRGRRGGHRTGRRGRSRHRHGGRVCEGINVSRDK